VIFRCHRFFFPITHQAEVLIEQHLGIATKIQEGPDLCDFLETRPFNRNSNF
jgi:hypothetical protein